MILESRAPAGILRATRAIHSRDEFKRHRACSKAEADVFLKEWTSYAITLAKQLSKRTAFQSFGVDLVETQLEDFREEQVVQLYELFQESSKPVSAGES